MKDWRQRFEQIAEWRAHPEAVDLTMRGSSFTMAAKSLKRLQNSMKPLLDNLLIFDVRELLIQEDSLLTKPQREYLRAFQTQD